MLLKSVILASVLQFMLLCHKLVFDLTNGLLGKNLV